MSNPITDNQRSSDPRILEDARIIPKIPAGAFTDPLESMPIVTAPPPSVPEPSLDPRNTTTPLGDFIPDVTAAAALKKVVPVNTGEVASPAEVTAQAKQTNANRVNWLQARQGEYQLQQYFDGEGTDLGKAMEIITPAEFKIAGIETPALPPEVAAEKKKLNDRGFNIDPTQNVVDGTPGALGGGKKGGWNVLEQLGGLAGFVGRLGSAAVEDTVADAKKLASGDFSPRKKETYNKGLKGAFDFDKRPLAPNESAVLQGLAPTNERTNLGKATFGDYGTGLVGALNYGMDNLLGGNAVVRGTIQDIRLNQERAKKGEPWQWNGLGQGLGGKSFSFVDPGSPLNVTGKDKKGGDFWGAFAGGMALEVITDVNPFNALRKAAVSGLRKGAVKTAKDTAIKSLRPSRASEVMRSAIKGLDNPLIDIVRPKTTEEILKSARKAATKARVEARKNPKGTPPVPVQIPTPTKPIKPSGSGTDVRSVRTSTSAEVAASIIRNNEFAKLGEAVPLPKLESKFSEPVKDGTPLLGVALPPLTDKKVLSDLRPRITSLQPTPPLPELRGKVNLLPPLPELQSIVKDGGSKVFNIASRRPTAVPQVVFGEELLGQVVPQLFRNKPMLDLDPNPLTNASKLPDLLPKGEKGVELMGTKLEQLYPKGAVGTPLQGIALPKLEPDAPLPDLQLKDYEVPITLPELLPKAIDPSSSGTGARQQAPLPQYTGLSSTGIPEPPGKVDPVVPGSSPLLQGQPNVTQQTPPPNLPVDSSLSVNPLDDLFNEADRVGNKYQTPEELAKFNAANGEQSERIADLIDEQFPDNTTLTQSPPSLSTPPKSTGKVVSTKPSSNLAQVLAARAARGEPVDSPMVASLKVISKEVEAGEISDASARLLRDPAASPAILAEAERVKAIVVNPETGVIKKGSDAVEEAERAITRLRIREDGVRAKPNYNKKPLLQEQVALIQKEIAEAQRVVSAGVTAVDEPLNAKLVDDAIPVIPMDTFAPATAPSLLYESIKNLKPGDAVYTSTAEFVQRTTSDLSELARFLGHHKGRSKITSDELDDLRLVHGSIYANVGHPLDVNKLKQYAKTGVVRVETKQAVAASGAAQESVVINRIPDEVAAPSTPNVAPLVEDNRVADLEGELNSLYEQANELDPDVDADTLADLDVRAQDIESELEQLYARQALGTKPYKQFEATLPDSKKPTTQAAKQQAAVVQQTEIALAEEMTRARSYTAESVLLSKAIDADMAKLDTMPRVEPAALDVGSYDKGLLNERVLGVVKPLTTADEFGIDINAIDEQVETALSGMETNLKGAAKSIVEADLQRAALYEQSLIELGVPDSKVLAARLAEEAVIKRNIESLVALDYGKGEIGEVFGVKKKPALGGVDETPKKVTANTPRIDALKATGEWEADYLRQADEFGLKYTDEDDLLQRIQVWKQETPAPTGSKRNQRDIKKQKRDAAKFVNTLQADDLVRDVPLPTATPNTPKIAVNALQPEDVVRDVPIPAQKSKLVQSMENATNKLKGISESIGDLRKLNDDIAANTAEIADSALKTGYAYAGGDVSSFYHGTKFDTPQLPSAVDTMPTRNPLGLGSYFHTNPERATDAAKARLTDNVPLNNTPIDEIGVVREVVPNVTKTLDANLDSTPEIKSLFTQAAVEAGFDEEVIKSFKRRLSVTKKMKDGTQIKSKVADQWNKLSASYAKVNPTETMPEDMFRQFELNVQTRLENLGFDSIKHTTDEGDTLVVFKTDKVTELAKTKVGTGSQLEQAAGAMNQALYHQGITLDVTSTVAALDAKVALGADLLSRSDELVEGSLDKADNAITRMLEADDALEATVTAQKRLDAERRLSEGAKEYTVTIDAIDITEYPGCL